MTYQTVRLSFNSLVKQTPFFIMATAIIFLFSQCSKRKSGEQPVLDSAYVTQYMNSKPVFKDDLYWAMQFYKEREYKLGWFKDHELVPQAEQMLGVVKRAGEEGLDPANYNVVDFDALLKELKGIKRDLEKRDELEKEIDAALSATYLNWASDYYRGLLEPREQSKADWDVKRNRMKLHIALQSVLGERESNLPYAQFKPMHPEYANLKKALANYRKIKAEGGWPKIPAGASLKPGQSSPVVPLLKKRLAAFIAPDSLNKGQDNAFTPELSAALKKFQEENGLTATGTLNKPTVAFMNIPVDDRIRQVIINMERWRWIPQSFEPNYLIVNIPEFRLRVYEKGKEEINMKVIVGKELNSTPIFSDLMEHVVLSPYWNIPPGILKNEIAPKVASNPGYLESMDMEVIDKSGNPVDPSSVDWSAAGTGSFPYTVRRKPGPKNDLGDVKFIFPNSMNIYLHDTPSTELFSMSKRDFSHGCVRVERPIDLAVYLLRDSGWDKSKIMDQVQTRKEKYVPLKKKMPVYLVYLTASADPNGKVRFYDDVYGHDQKLKSMYFSKL
ncbi:murein L,D-transpeptidase [Pararcticibacter amylolyticus]|uniref:Murein L,D-transpeptidase n=2 Tax=Pararcticibacter amylolyticus TaxID=2173175 RepID=A0A2U2PFI6_9SPHI|nr:murein L,D-transpeptidase [Pararcticibacter amylolyticus]